MLPAAVLYQNCNSLYDMQIKQFHGQPPPPPVYEFTFGGAGGGNNEQEEVWQERKGNNNDQGDYYDDDEDGGGEDGGGDLKEEVQVDLAEESHEQLPPLPSSSSSPSSSFPSEDASLKLLSRTIIQVCEANRTASVILDCSKISFPTACRMLTLPFIAHLKKIGAHPRGLHRFVIVTPFKSIRKVVARIIQSKQARTYTTIKHTKQEAYDWILQVP
jgi:hypothetical protein